VLKICVKLPSPEADPDTPGAEKPRELLCAGGVAGFTDSSVLRRTAGGAALVPPTKSLVNSPGAPAWSAPV